MKRKRFTEEQIVGILKEHEAGVSVSELCRKHGVSDASIYKWKAKYGGLEVSEAKRLNRAYSTVRANSKLDKSSGQGH
jgi:putative transposase